LGQTKLEQYEYEGGLRNRSVTEIVAQLRPDLKGDALIRVCDELVEKKLSYLIGEIGVPTGDGAIWPPLCKGISQFWPRVTRARRAGHLLTGIITSGHDVFTRRILELHGLEPPDVMVTDDDMRGRGDLDSQRRSKPDPLMIEMACRQLGLSDYSGVTYFGDDQTKDGQMARNAGVRFGHFDPSAGPGLHVDTLGNFRFSDWTELLSEPELRRYATSYTK
jgi:hypothetical protein